MMHGMFCAVSTSLPPYSCRTDRRAADGVGDTSAGSDGKRCDCRFIIYLHSHLPFFYFCGRVLNSGELRNKRVSSRKEPTFPMKLHQMLSDPDAEGVIVWLPHGRAWKIINQDKFETGLLGKYFEHGNMSSFMRQVNGWDFRRIVKGVDEQSYYHEVSIQLDRHLILMWHHLRIDLNLIAPFLALDVQTSIQTVACVQPQNSSSFVVCPIFAR